MTASRIQDLVDKAWPSVSKWVADALTAPDKRDISKAITGRTMPEAEWKSIAKHADAPPDESAALESGVLYRSSRRLLLTETDLVRGSFDTDLKKRVTAFVKDALAGQTRRALSFAARGSTERFVPRPRPEESQRLALVRLLRTLRDSKPLQDWAPLVTCSKRDQKLGDDIGGMDFVEFDAALLPQGIVAMVVPQGIATVRIDRAHDLQLTWDWPTSEEAEVATGLDPPVAVLVLEERFTVESTLPSAVFTIAMPSVPGPS